MTDVKDMLGFSDEDDDLQSSSSSRRGMPPPPHVSHSMRATGRMPSLDGATKKKVKKGTRANSFPPIYRSDALSTLANLQIYITAPCVCLFSRNALTVPASDFLSLPFTHAHTAHQAV
jgi:hypothetical protein